ncbi:hypothetical protein [Aestuariivirga sp.]|uniref:hypothetical protein n=1 Tax=Aestuariivirga sp. TaxID=2650926 RepID=UPI0039E603D8
MQAILKSNGCAKQDPLTFELECMSSKLESLHTALGLLTEAIGHAVLGRERLVQRAAKAAITLLIEFKHEQKMAPDLSQEGRAALLMMRDAGNLIWEAQLEALVGRPKSAGAYVDAAIEKLRDMSNFLEFRQKPNDADSSGRPN